MFFFRASHKTWGGAKNEPSLINSLSELFDDFGLHSKNFSLTIFRNMVNEKFYQREPQKHEKIESKFIRIGS